ncbi:MAG: DUF503 domain-containing protein [Chrysiogenales bacterium]|jgi:uncharacterized protein YlxP (DUF503 family)|nr:MAG: DUF503 domain-containing protein [Chrysiogenales bacterium]
MMIGLLEIDLFSEQFHSLKEKRRLLSSLKERLKHKFNIAVVESAYQDLWQQAQLSVVSLGPNRSILENTFKQIEDFIFLNYALQISKINIRYF